MASSITALSDAISAGWKLREEEERARYAIEPGERRRALCELSPCTFLGRALTVQRLIADGTSEVHTLNLGDLRVKFEAFYGKLSWSLGFDDSDRHFTIASRSSYKSGELTPALCMEQAEAALADFKAQVAKLGVE